MFTRALHSRPLATLVTTSRMLDSALEAYFRTVRGAFPFLFGPRKLRELHFCFFFLNGQGRQAFK